MLQPALPTLETAAPAGWERWLIPAIFVAAGVSLGLILLLLGLPLIVAGAAALVGVAAAAVAAFKPATPIIEPAALAIGPDYALAGSALGLLKEPAALTSHEGSLLIANAAYRDRFGGAKPPLTLAADVQGREAVAVATSMAWRDGGGCVGGVLTEAGTVSVKVVHGEN